AAVGGVPGGLAIVTVGGWALFTTVTGASGATIIAGGGLGYPALVKEGDKERFSLGLVTGTGAIGPPFPPALPLVFFGIIYGVAAQANARGGGGDAMVLIDFDVQRFLFAGIVPGLVLCGMVMLYSVYVAIRDKVPTTPFVLRDAWRTGLRAAP